MLTPALSKGEGERASRWRTDVHLSPGAPLRTSQPLPADAPSTGRLTLRLLASDGGVGAEYGAEFALK